MQVGVVVSGFRSPRPQPLWHYDFIADFDGKLSMKYDVISDGDKIGLEGWNISWSGPGGGAQLLDFFDPTTSGTFTRDIVAGNFYALGLESSSWLGTSGKLVGSVDGAFDFPMTTTVGNKIPEPGNLALLGIALAGLVAAVRRKNGAATKLG